MVPMTASDYTVDGASAKKITQIADDEDDDDYINLQETQMKALPSVSQAVDDEKYAYIDMPRPPAPAARPDETIGDAYYFDPFATYETPKGNDDSSPSMFKPNNTLIINKNRTSLMPQ